MAAFRRHLFVVTWMILSAHWLGVAVSAASACLEREHTHNGTAAPDCPMHHQAAPPTQSSGHHGHHMPAPEPDTSGTPQLSCRCSGDPLTMLLGQLAVLPPAASYSPFVLAMTVDRLGDPQAVDLWAAPPSPPPR